LVPTADQIWGAPENGRHLEFASAPVGSLIFQYEGDPYLIGMSVAASGTEATRVAINLETFQAELLSDPLEDDRTGFGGDFTVDVDPLSAYHITNGPHGSGHLAFVGSQLFFAAHTAKDHVAFFRLSSEPIPMQKAVGFASWRLFWGGSLAFSSVDNR
jgi:hypothetical protein